MVHRDAQRMKTRRGLAVKADGRFVKGMPGPALAGLERFDACSLKPGYGAAVGAAVVPARSSAGLDGRPGRVPPPSSP